MPDDAWTSHLQAAGAVFGPEATAAPHALHFGDPRNEYLAAREDAALFELVDRTQIEITGNDRAKFLHNFCTNDIKGLAPGGGCEAFVTNVKGRVIGHVFAFAGEQSLWIETVAGQEEPLLAHLDRYLITEDVELHGRTADRAELFVSGPAAGARLAAAGIPAELPPYAHEPRDLQGVEVHLRRVDPLGAPGFLLSAGRDHAAGLWTMLRDAGFPPAGAEAFHALRIEAVMPLFGVDVTDEHLAPEVGRNEQAISYTKGCYLGQEPIARIDALGHVNRKLRGLKFASAAVPAPGTPVLSIDAGGEIGRITSAALSPAEGKAVALAYLKSDFLRPGTTVSVSGAEASVFAGTT